MYLSNSVIILLCQGLHPWLFLRKIDTLQSTLSIFSYYLCLHLKNKKHNWESAHLSIYYISLPHLYLTHPYTHNLIFKSLFFTLKFKTQIYLYASLNLHVPIWTYFCLHILLSAYLIFFFSVYIFSSLHIHFSIFPSTYISVYPHHHIDLFHSYFHQCIFHVPIQFANLTLRIT
jgi:hypothetical protein